MSSEFALGDAVRPRVLECGVLARWLYTSVQQRTFAGRVNGPLQPQVPEYLPED